MEPQEALAQGRHLEDSGLGQLVLQPQEGACLVVVVVQAHQPSGVLLLVLEGEQLPHQPQSLVVPQQVVGLVGQQPEVDLVVQRRQAGLVQRLQEDSEVQRLQAGLVVQQLQEGLVVQRLQEGLVVQQLVGHHQLLAKRNLPEEEKGNITALRRG